MANVILTPSMAVELPAPPPQEGGPMPDEAAAFPRWYFRHAGGRIFDSQADLDAASAEGPWFTTPTEAAQAPADDETESPPPPRRHR